MYYADATAVSEQGYVPYAWQFRDETLGVPSQRGRRLNLFGIYSRANHFHYWTTPERIDADYVIAVLDAFSWKIRRPTVLVLDNASPHRNGKVRALLKVWQRRGLYLFYLPPYSPQLNPIERLWQEIKSRYLQAEDYTSADHLFYALNQVCAAVGSDIVLNWKDIGSS